MMSTNIPSGHSVVGLLEPYPVEYCVSKEKRKHDIKSFISVTHGSLKQETNKYHIKMQYTVYCSTFKIGYKLCYAM